jgi:endonuclease YncB( thermonuclease family)
VGTRPIGLVVVPVVLWLFVVGLAYGVAFGVRSMNGVPRARLVVLALVVPILLVVSFFVTKASTGAEEGLVSVPTHVACAILTSTIALLALAYGAHYLGLPSQVADALNGTPERFDIEGPAETIDGDTLRIGEARVRLDGIDAPESDQPCTTKTRPIMTFACGSSAAGKLRALTDGAVVRCVANGTDKYGRTLATCYAGDTDVGRAMVRAGWALAYRRYSARYGLEEAAARLEELGLWATEFDNPEDWRHREGG